MKITINNFTEYILFLCCLCMEIELADFYEYAPYGLQYKEKMLTAVMSDKLIRKFRYDTSAKAQNAFGSKTQLRITKSKGEGAAMNLSTSLLLHYDLLCPQRGRTRSGIVSGGRFSGSATHVERQRRLSRIMQHYHYNGIMVDMISAELFASNKQEDFTAETNMFAGYIKEKTIFANDGSLLPPEDILSRLGREDTCFLTLKALSKMNIQSDSNGKNIMFRTLGLLIKGDIAYSVYLIGSAGEKWNKNNESLSEAQVRRLTAPLMNEVDRGRGAAIFYTPNEKVCADMFIRKGIAKNQVIPEGVYDKAYVIPLKRATPMLEQLLLIKDWKKKVTEILLAGSGKTVEDKEFDAMVLGREVYTLIGNDLVQIQKARVRAKVQPQVLIMQDWQEDIIRDYYGDLIKDVTIWTYNEKEMSELHRIIITQERID